MNKVDIDVQNALAEEDQLEEVVDKGYKVQLIVFKLGDEEYALPIEQVKEIVLTPRISEVPQTPEYVRGIANIRGEVISIMDLEKKFGLRSKSKTLSETPGSTNYTMVIESNEYSIGILVNQVPNTLSVYSSKIDNTSNILQHSHLDDASIKGVVKEKEKMIILIDVLSMLNIGELKTKLHQDTA